MVEQRSEEPRCVGSIPTVWANTIVIFTMKITISELRQIIRSVVKENYGWPVEKEILPYGRATKIDVQNKHDPKNSQLIVPKGPNTKSKTMNESFQRITPRELTRWQNGDYSNITEDVEEETQDPCDACGALVNSSELSEVDGKFLCGDCNK